MANVYRDKHYVAGYCAGDGLLYSDKFRGYEVKFVDSNRDFMTMFTDLMERLYGVKLKIVKQRNAYIIRLFRKEIYEDIYIKIFIKLLNNV